MRIKKLHIRKKIDKRGRLDLQGEDIADDEAGIDGDGEEAGVGGECAGAILLQRVRELHEIDRSTRSSPRGRSSDPGVIIRRKVSSVAAGRSSDGHRRFPGERDWEVESSLSHRSRKRDFKKRRG